MDSMYNIRLLTRKKIKQKSLQISNSNSDLNALCDLAKALGALHHLLKMTTADIYLHLVKE